jgi:enoyl-CoA hydratase/carnithine racemase
MNKEHRYNMLTPGFINELRRGVETHNIDNDRDVIYMAPRQGEHFSIGTDFRMISHMKKEENYDKIAEYFEQLYSL